MHFLRKPLCGLLLALGPALPACAASDWPTLWRQAQQHNLEWRQSSRSADFMQAEMEQAQTRPNPELSISQEGQGAQRSRSVQLSMPIETGGKRAARIALAHSNQALQALEQSQKRQQIQADLRLAFYEALAAQQRQTLSHEALTLAQQAHHLSTQRVAAGKISPQEQARTELALAQAGLDVRQAELALQLSLSRLAGLAGLPAVPAVQGKLEHSPPAPPWPALQAALEQAPAWRHIQSTQAQAQAASALERSKAMPDLQFAVGLKQTVETAPGANPRQLLLSLAIPLPLFERNQGARGQAELRARAAQQDGAAQQLQLQQQLQQAWRNWRQAQQESWQIGQTLLPQAQQIVEAALQGFRHGKFSYLELQEAQRSQAALQARQIQAQLDVWRAIAEVERINGPLAP
ncbi:TolC family protein [Massilia sp. W12]|uniref:TolC family protein n=1 Tax=Massilia sp. W12 TaxID=3126507 RepID=UPI0030CC5803